MSGGLDLAIIGLSITSSWGNGHATTYRALVRALSTRGHRVRFLERNQPWYAANRDLAQPPYGETHLYDSLDELFAEHGRVIRDADAVIVGSFVPEGVHVGQWVTTVAQGVTAFYDIDTPVTLNRLRTGDARYITRDLVPRYDLYLSFTGGPTLDLLTWQLGARRAVPLYCCVDPELYYPEVAPRRWDLGYLGTYSADRQEALTDLLLNPARRSPGRRFVVAGPQYPAESAWPANVERIEHLAPDSHRAFYNAQRFTLNVTRAPMIRAGYSPSVRLFESAACGTPIISDYWPGLDEFFRIGEEVLVARTCRDVLDVLDGVAEAARDELGRRARERVLGSHTAAHRAHELEQYIMDCVTPGASRFAKHDRERVGMAPQ